MPRDSFISADNAGSPRADDATGIGDHTVSGRYRGHVRTLLRAALEGEAHTEPALRSAIEARAATRASGTQQTPDVIPVELHHYVDTVARHAWKVTDADVTALKQAGFSEDTIFEITVCAALGAATGRLRQAYNAMKGAG